MTPNSPRPSRSRPVQRYQQRATKSGTRAALVMATVAAVVAAGVVGWLLIDDADKNAGPDSLSSSAVLVRPDSHRLGPTTDSPVTFVEFLDFECEACGALFPAIEKLRADYGDRVTFVVRYFPLSSHFNAERAARAVEAAAQQGKLEEMYKRMYQTQTQWAEQRTPKDTVFRTLAAQVGLNMDIFDKAYNDPATLARVRVDTADGQALGVESTPTFFVNNSKLEPRNYNDFTQALDKALAGAR